MKFGHCYIPDYHAGFSGSWQDWYEGRIAEVKLAKGTGLSRQAFRDPVAYKDWKGFFENRETVTLDQMKATRAVIGRAEECIEKLAMLTEQFGITQLCFEVSFGALPHERVMASLRRFAEQVMPSFG